ncbi:phosphonopyruvate decarboxylase [Balneola vulgaris]|uniref:phosphonopyruvate decarboxylase n=1 Tax=Balneola vulgaris TaxID=287535 RepID=UPI000379E341|nr:phosphonopyruvate decarboxylase [Balneola vulgaris]
MVKNELLFEALKKSGIEFYCGVPDSLLKDFCAFLTDNTSSKEHIITANEGGAIALASGYHMATSKVPLVYLQNSGLGNIVNPILSLADKEVYGIPMLIMIGWRGEPGVHDEPQHKKQGRVQNDLLDCMEIPYMVLDESTSDVSQFVKKAISKTVNLSTPVAIVVRKNTFEPYQLKSSVASDYMLSRESAIQQVLEQLEIDDIVVSTTGKPSREVFEFRVSQNFGNQNDFLTVGSMGHCSQIALGIALHTDRNVFCIDGDGSVIMHMGGLSITGQSGAKNFRHIVLNNGAHDSVGGQPTVGFEISISEIALANGYKKVFKAKDSDSLKSSLERFLKEDGPVLLEVCIKKGARKDLGRPTSTPEENKKALMKLLNS